MRARFKALQLPCHICGKSINYELPSDSQHPTSFVIDEIKPVSRWREFGYESASAACRDINNLAPAHYACNAMKSNKMPGDRVVKTVRLVNKLDGAW